MIRRRHHLVALAALGLAVGGLAVACGDDGSSEAGSDPAPATTADAAPTVSSAEETATEPAPVTTETAPPPAPEPGLPAYTAGYQDWVRLNPQPIPPDPAAPHGDGDKNVFVSVPRADAAGVRDGGTYPDGAVVVKEGAVGADPAAIVAIMRKELGVDPTHGDWDFIEYSRPSADAGYTVLAQDATCWGCHMAAENTDWVYTTLP